MTAVVVRRDPPDEKYAKVTRVWEGRTAVVIATGPSLSREQADRCRGLPCIAVNDAYLLAPWAEICYFADGKWWDWSRKRAEFQSFGGLKVSINNSMHAIKDPNVLFLRNAADAGLRERVSIDPTAINTGHNSAYQAGNIASLAGATRIIFLGLDGKPGAGGKKHFFGDHPDRTEPPYQALREAFRYGSDEVTGRGIEWVNCSPGTAVDSLRTAKLEDELARVVADQTAALVPG